MKKLLQGLEKFQSGYFDEHRQLFEQLSHGQKPRILFITCSDSRIDPNLITQAEVGELFVIRNAGNIIPPYGATNGGEGASIEYAINALGIEQVIICGHSHCGAMKGLLKLQSLADEIRAKMREEEISEGHIILAFGDDQRIGRRLFKRKLSLCSLCIWSCKTGPFFIGSC